MSLPLLCSKLHFAYQYPATKDRFQAKPFYHLDSDSPVLLSYGLDYFLLSFVQFSDGDKDCTQGREGLENPNTFFKFQLFETEFNFELHGSEVSKSANVRDHQFHVLNCFLLLQVTASEYKMETVLKMVISNVQGLYYPIKGMCILQAFKRANTHQFYQKRCIYFSLCSQIHRSKGYVNFPPSLLYFSCGIAKSLYYKVTNSLVLKFVLIGFPGGQVMGVNGVNTSREFELFVVKWENSINCDCPKSLLQAL